MVLCIIILFICVLTQYPIDGTINTESYLSKIMSKENILSINDIIYLYSSNNIIKKIKIKNKYIFNSD